MRKEHYFAFFTIVLMPVILFVFLEVFLRVTKFISPNIKIIKNNIVLNKPFSSIYNKKENFNLVQFNNFGFHDFDRQKNNENYRIAVLGDSFVESLQVPRDSLFTTILNKKYQAKDSIEFLPFGKSGTSTTYQFKLWEYLVLNDIKIDHLVLVMFLGNDIENNHINLGNAPADNAFYLNEKGEIFLNYKKKTIFKKIINKIRNHSAFFELIYQRLYMLKRILKNSQKEEIDKKGSKNIQYAKNQKHYHEAIEGTIALISKWRSSLNSNNIEFSLITFNTTENNIIQNYFLEMIDIDSTLKTLKHKNIVFPDTPYKYFFKTEKGYGHFNFYGHKYFSTEISTFLELNYPRITSN